MDKLLKDLLRDQMEAKGVTLERVKQQTGIAERYIMAFLEGKKEKLPAAPYVRGYLIRIASLLDLNGQELWKMYENELVSKRSGAKDIMPFNRYALKKINKKMVVGALVAALFAFYGIMNVSRFLGGGQLEIVNPAAETVVTTANLITLSGKSSPNDKLMIDNEEVPVDESGNFSKEYTLLPGLNRVEFSVKRLLGREIRTVRQIIYQPEIKP